MKLLLSILISSILLADSIHNFKKVSFYGKTLDDVQLVLNSDGKTFVVYYQGKPLHPKLMIVSCNAPEKFCLVRSTRHTGWNK